jgi:beta-galactosidase
MKKSLILASAALPVFLLVLAGCSGSMGKGLPVSFNDDWLFLKQDTIVPEENIPSAPDDKWEKVTIPHTAAIEPSVVTGKQWTGLCWYKKIFKADRKFRGRHVALLFDGAMNDALIYLNGVELYHNTGGYLPFYVDLTKDLIQGKENEILIKLDNRENRQIPPGKPLRDLDFLYYSGIYRNVSLIIKDKLHITNAVEVDTLYGGGVRTGFSNVTDEKADVRTSTFIRNDDKTLRIFSLHSTLLDAGGNSVAEADSANISLMPGIAASVPMMMNVKEPALWSPEHPFLYTLRTEIIEGETVIDENEERVGIRDLKITPENGLVLNGEKIKIRGTNRHQEYPCLGYALSDNANYRDAYKIKEAGFNFVRCSHYPQAPAFLSACDELGIMVMDAIPGWQFIGDSIFCNAAINDTRLMCRRDRNHPSIILWESSLNETWMPYRFLSELNKAAHSELSLSQCYTCSWMDTICDVFIPARQHAKAPNYWNNYKKRKPLLICEYGDWEYYANNAGFNQTEFSDLSPSTRNSRQLRSAGERALLQQAFNYQEAHNNNLAGPAIGDANWLMYDYNRGYAPDIESSGIMDIFRLPKFAYWFYKSQSEKSPVCFIAYYNLPSSGNLVRVFSNADSVLLYCDDTIVARQGADINPNTVYLNHPPFTFKVSGTSHTIRAEGIKDGKTFATHSVTAPSAPAAIRLSADFSNRPLHADGSDALFVYASVVDSTDNIVFNADSDIEFSIKGDAVIISENPVKAQAGIAPIVIKAGTKPGKITIRARANGISQAEMMIESKD